MSEPLPIACDSSAAYAEAQANADDSEAAAQKCWETAFRFDKEDRQPEHLLVYGGQIAFTELVSRGPRPDEQTDAWPSDETTRFGGYARLLWDGLLDHELITDQ